MRRTSFWLTSLFGAGLLLPLIALPGCSSDDDTDEGPTASPTPSDTPTMAPTTDPGDDDDVTRTPPDIGDDDATVPEANLEELAWYPANHAALLDFAETYGTTGNPQDAPAVVFEWEDVAAFGEIGPTTFRYQLANLLFKVTPGQMEEIVPISAGADFYAPASVTHLSEDFGGLSIADLQSDIISDYNTLYNSYEGLGCASSCTPLEDLKSGNAYKDFVAKMIFLYEGLRADPQVGADFANPMITRLLGGFTEAQAQQLGLEAYNAQLEYALGEVTVTSPKQGKAGSVSVTFLQGVRPVEEMLNLFDYLRRSGFDIWIVTSSSQAVVAGVTGATSGYLVQADRVLGIALEPDKGRTPPMTIQLKAGQPVPFGDGKVDLIDQLIGKEPLLVVGGSTGDYEMLTTWKDQALQLVVNQNAGCPMSELYQLADSASGDYLLQGRNDNLGMFVTAQETIEYGASSPTALPTGSCD